MYEGTRLGCIGRCRKCGKAIQLRRTTKFNWDDKSIMPGDHDAWAHFVTTDHPAELSAGVGSYYDEMLSAQQCERDLSRLHPSNNPNLT